MTLNRKLTSLLKGDTIQGVSLEAPRMSITFGDGSVLSFNTTEAEPEEITGSLETVLDDDTTLRIVTHNNGADQPTDFGLTSNPAVLVRDHRGAITYSD